MTEKNRVKLSICGYDFIISSDDSEDYMRDVGTTVEKRIAKIIQNSDSMSTSMAAIFSALEFCDEAYKARLGEDNLRTQIRSYLEEAETAKQEAAALAKKVDNLTRELEQARRSGLPGRK